MPEVSRTFMPFPYFYLLRGPFSKHIVLFSLLPLLIFLFSYRVSLLLVVLSNPYTTRNDYT